MVNMEKSSDFVANGAPNSTGPKRRRICGLDSLTFSAVLLFTAFVLWSADIRALLWAPHKHTCQKHLTIEERAVKILKENPLIGQYRRLLLASAHLLTFWRWP